MYSHDCIFFPPILEKRLLEKTLLLTTILILSSWCGMTVSSVATCPRVKTSMETWDWSPLSNTIVQFTNTTTADDNKQWNVHLCAGVYSVGCWPYSSFNNLFKSQIFMFLQTLSRLHLWYIFVFSFASACACLAHVTLCLMCQIFNDHREGNPDME